MIDTWWSLSCHDSFVLFVCKILNGSPAVTHQYYLHGWYLMMQLSWLFSYMYGYLMTELSWLINVICMDYVWWGLSCSDSLLLVWRALDNWRIIAVGTLYKHKKNFLHYIGRDVSHHYIWNVLWNYTKHKNSCQYGRFSACVLEVLHTQSYIVQ